MFGGYTYLLFIMIIIKRKIVEKGTYKYYLSDVIKQKPFSACSYRQGTANSMCTGYSEWQLIYLT